MEDSTLSPEARAELKAKHKEEKKRKKAEALLKQDTAPASTLEASAPLDEEAAHKKRKLEKALKKAAKAAEQMKQIAAGVEPTTAGMTASATTTALEGEIPGSATPAVPSRDVCAHYITPIAKPFSPPGHKLTKKILFLVNETAKVKGLVLGIKLVRKALERMKVDGSAASKEKNLLPTPAGVGIGLGILAANVAPLDVISHMPGLFEDKNLPYVWVPSRYELGLACLVKRPVTCVFLQVAKLPPEHRAMYDKVEKLVREMYKMCFV